MEIEEYITAHIDAEPDYLKKMNRDAHVMLINPRMTSGHFQGRFLSMIAHMIQPKYILELGTYIGYSALCMAEALPEDGVVHTIDTDDELEETILRNLSTTPHGKKVRLHIGKALEIIPTLSETFDLVFIDADKREYSAYYNAIFDKVRPGGYILADNTLWSGKVVESLHHNDKQTAEILHFNEYIAKDTRIEKVIVPLRDGLTMIRKKL